MTTIGVVTVPAPDDRPVTLWGWAPRWVFHLVLVVPALGWLWSRSVPGIDFGPWIASMIALAAGALVWGIRLTTYLVARMRHQPTAGGWWFAVVPLCGLLALLLAVAGVPLEARWALSRSDFEEVVDTAMQDEDYRSITDQRLGLFTITNVYGEGDAVIFREETGGLFDDAGFAYLPDGPFPELERRFETPRFRHLDGPWYTWTASW